MREQSPFLFLVSTFTLATLAGIGLGRFFHYEWSDGALLGQISWCLVAVVEFVCPSKPTKRRKRHPRSK
jgi:hypothetical protein